VAVVAACGAMLLIQPDIGAAQAQEEPELRMPGGKPQQEELLRRDYEENLKDAARLVDLAQSLKNELEKGSYRILSMNAIKTTEEIERISKRIRNRMRR
jgi:hypothetical protein